VPQFGTIAKDTFGISPRKDEETPLNLDEIQAPPDSPKPV